MELVKGLASRFPQNFQPIEDVCVAKGGKTFKRSGGGASSPFKTTTPMALERHLSMNKADADSLV